jgi:hypothetical protein
MISWQRNLTTSLAFTQTTTFLCQQVKFPHRAIIWLFLPQPCRRHSTRRYARCTVTCRSHMLFMSLCNESVFSIAIVAGITSHSPSSHDPTTTVTADDSTIGKTLYQLDPFHDSVFAFSFMLQSNSIESCACRWRVIV